MSENPNSGVLVKGEMDNEVYYPLGVPGGFFIYEASEDEAILFADENVRGAIVDVAAF